MKATKLILGLLGVLLLAVSIAPASAIMTVDGTPSVSIDGVAAGTLDDTIEVPTCGAEVGLTIPMTNLDNNPTTNVDIILEFIYGGKSETFTQNVAVPITVTQDTLSATVDVDFSTIAPVVEQSGLMRTTIWDPDHMINLEKYDTAIDFTTCVGDDDDDNDDDNTVTEGVITDVDFDDDMMPGETVELEIDLENPSEDYDLMSIKIEGWLEDDSGDRVTDKEFVEKTRIKDADEDTVTLKIDLPADLEDDTYEIVLELEAEFDDDDNTEVSENWNGEIDIEKADDALLVKAVTLTSSTVVPGTQVSGKVEIVNTGLNDQAYVTLVAEIPELGVYYSVPLLNDIREGEIQYGYFTLDMPTSAASGLYFIDVSVSNAEVYEMKQVTLSISGEGDAPGATMPGSEIQLIPAGTTIDAPIGKGGVYTITVANTGTQMRTISLDASGFENWAGLRIEPQSFTLGAGETKTANIYLTPNSNTNEGMKSFTIYANSNGVSVAYQTLNANVAGTTFGPIENYLRWIFGAVVLVLIVLLIAYVVKGNEFGSKRQAAEIEQIYY